ncbi:MULTISPECIES: hypothetical protein [Bacillus]|uniref:Cthe-2314-like HEPN domain-containing protein n=2 Tax=Bacillus TaxID=1386 RepID=A0A0M4FTM9_9BACI|nr:MULTISPECIES: hypothetical protein [Bacillus]ALC83084.1 hypothetical protein AM592_17020 [Bacillus gobiensis]MBP1082133.1 hypothetical protein [Bacillus capparidis]MED1096752.1 hypothetical protein [Bacillus capparidis]
MTHWFEYSIVAVHMKNAKDCIEKMQKVTFKEIGYNYGKVEEGIFFNNTRYGVLAIYSINATLETTVAMTSRVLTVKAKHFNVRVDKLTEKGIITKDLTLKNLIQLRKIRNLISHWEENHLELLGTSSYLPVMFSKTVSKNKNEELISMLTPDRMNQYLDDLAGLLNNIIHNIDKEKYNRLYYSLKQIRDGLLVIGY